MDQLTLNYAQDDAPNGTGDLEITVWASEFTGRMRSYVAETQMAEFARQLEAYPLPAPRALLALDLNIEIGSHGNLGRLRVSIDLSDTRARDVEQRAALQFISDYAALDTFKNELSRMAREGRGTATLKGHL